MLAIYLFSILHMHAKFQALRFNNKKKKYLKVVDPPVRLINYFLLLNLEA